MMYLKSSVFRSFLMALPALLFCECTSNIDNTETQEEEYIEIGFKSSLIEYSESPMMPTRAFSDRDIFGVEIHDELGLNYAAWLTSDLSSDVVKLVKNKRYVCYLAYMPNGLDIVNVHSDGTLGLPFSPMGSATTATPKMNNGVSYGNYSIDFCNFGCVQKKGMQSRGYGYNLWSDVDIYCGIREICASEDITLTINLYRMMFGLKVDVKNLKEGEVKVAEGSTLSTYVYTLTPSNPSMDKVLELRYMPWNDLCPRPDSVPTDEQLLNWTSDGELDIEYVSPSGESFVILRKFIETKRLTRYSYSFDLDDFRDGYSGTLNAKITDENWTDADL